MDNQGFEGAVHYAEKCIASQRADGKYFSHLYSIKKKSGNEMNPEDSGSIVTGTIAIVPQ